MWNISIDKNKHVYTRRFSPLIISTYVTQYHYYYYHFIFPIAYQIKNQL